MKTMTKEFKESIQRSSYLFAIPADKINTKNTKYFIKDYSFKKIHDDILDIDLIYILNKYDGIYILDLNKESLKSLIKESKPDESLDRINLHELYSNHKILDELSVFNNADITGLISKKLLSCEKRPSNVYSHDIFIGVYNVPDVNSISICDMYDILLKEEINKVHSCIKSCKVPYAVKICDYVCIKDLSNYDKKEIYIDSTLFPTILDRCNYIKIPSLIDFRADRIQYESDIYILNASSEFYLIKPDEMVINIPKDMAGKSIGANGIRAKFLKKHYNIRSFNIIDK